MRRHRTTVLSLILTGLLGTSLFAMKLSQEEAAHLSTLLLADRIAHLQAKALPRVTQKVYREAHSLPTQQVIEEGIVTENDFEALQQAVARMAEKRDMLVANNRIAKENINLEELEHAINCYKVIMPYRKPKRKQKEKDLRWAKQSLHLFKQAMNQETNNAATPENNDSNVSADNKKRRKLVVNVEANDVFSLGRCASRKAIEELGRAWVGPNATQSVSAKKRGALVLMSEDKLRQWRDCKFKKGLDMCQSNFEWKHSEDGPWKGNGHIDLLETSKQAVQKSAREKILERLQLLKDN